MANEAKKDEPSLNEVRRKDSTSDYPMVDLRDVCEFVHTIWEKGVQSEPMSIVAKECGYSAPTSTGFYRRMTASRLFKMIDAQNGRLTHLALDYVKPDSDDAKTRALREAVRSVPNYQPLFEKYSGTKLNAGTLSNGITRVSNLTDECALICAKVFIESLRFAGELAADYTLFATRKSGVGEVAKTLAAQEQGPTLLPFSSIAAEGNMETYSLILDAAKKRRVVVQAPPSVSPAELKRIQDWLSFQLIVEETPAN